MHRIYLRLLVGRLLGSVAPVCEILSGVRGPAPAAAVAAAVAAAEVTAAGTEGIVAAVVLVRARVVRMANDLVSY